MNRKLLLLALLPVAFGAVAQPLPPGGGGLGASSGVAALYTYGNTTGVGNGADTTEDTLLTYNIPAGTLKNAGDRIRVVASGTFAGTTDAKVARVRIGGGQVVQGVNGSSASVTGWHISVEMQRIITNSQISDSFAIVNNAATGAGSGVSTMPDTSAMAVTVTGQNSTAATANSIVVRYVTVEYLP